MDIDFLEVCSIALDDLDERETHGRLVCQHDPEAAVTLRLLQGVLARCHVQNGLGRHASKQPGSSQLNGRQLREIVWTCRGDRVLGRHGHSTSAVIAKQATRGRGRCYRA
jgi:hypothetical protein